MQKKHSIDTLKSVEKSLQFDTKEFANDILKGLKKPSDDDLTFACMDSLTSNNPQTRNFYWQVFQVILDKTDGALSEVVGSYSMGYLEKFPNEFVRKYAKLNKKQRDMCISLVASEYYLSVETDEEVNKIFNKIKLSCNDCKTTEKDILGKFEKDILAEIKLLKAND
jgi:hypothetical protein